MKTLTVQNTITIGDTEFSYHAEVKIEEETYEVPGSTDVEIISIAFEGEFNPFEIKATREFMVKPGQRLTTLIEKNIDFFTCNDENIRDRIEDDAIEEI